MSSDGGSSDAAAPDSAAEAARGAGGDAQGGKGSGSARLTAAESLGREQIRAATMTVHVPDVTEAAREAVRTAESLGGFLESEQTADAKTTVTLRVPPADFTKASEALARLGTVTTRTVTTEDVTGDVADVDGRLKAARASTTRVRSLLGRATSISEITDLEAELTSRESDLESLATRRRVLEGRTSFASITATFVKPVAAVAAPRRDVSPGFGGGLRAGWEVFVAAGSVLLVVLGALLPFLGLAALVGGPVWYLRRRRVTARA